MKPARMFGLGAPPYEANGMADRLESNGQVKVGYHLQSEEADAGTSTTNVYFSG